MTTQDNPFTTELRELVARHRDGDRSPAGVEKCMTMAGSMTIVLADLLFELECAYPPLKPSNLDIVLQHCLEKRRKEKTNEPPRQ